MHHESSNMPFLRPRMSLMIVVLSALLVPFVFGTSPLPPPYHRYYLSGTLTWSDGAPAAGVTVIMLARTEFDTTLRVVVENIRHDDKPLGVTGPDGTFVLSGSLELEAESLSVGQIAPGRPMVLSEPFRPDTVNVLAMMKRGTADAQSGCSGCAADPSPYEYIEYYYHSLSLTLSLPLSRQGILAHAWHG